MTELTLKELSPYLPYGLKFLPTHYNKDKKIDTLYYLSTMYNSDEFAVNGYTSKYIKPILRPLTDLVKTIEHDGSSFVPCRLLNTDFTDLIKHPEDYRHTSYIIVNALLEWHFDIFGLIGRGLAIDINTLIMEIKKK